MRGRAGPRDLLILAHAGSPKALADLRQVPIGRYVADFVCLRHRLIVEADGPFHENSAHDVERDAWLRAEGFRAPGFPNLAIETRPNDVVAAIVGSAKGAAASSARPLIRPALAGHLLPRGEKGTSAVWITRALPAAAATAERVRDLGFEAVVAPLLAVRQIAAKIDLADVAALARLIAAHRPSLVLHPGGRDRAGDLTGLLRPHGVEVRAVTLYETAPTTLAAPPDAFAVLLHSAKAARELAALLQRNPAPDLAALCLSLIH